MALQASAAVVLLVVKLHPKAAKINLAKIIVTQYHSKSEADKQAQEFDRAFKDKGFPTDAPVINIAVSGVMKITDILVEAKLSASKGEAKRKIQEGAIEVDGSKVSDINLELGSGREYKIRAGKRFAGIFLK